jgi:hypothetical protein
MWESLIRGVLAALEDATTPSVRVASHGRIAVVGLIGNQPLSALGQPEIRHAFTKMGMREAHNSKFISQLIQRGPQHGVHTLSDFARAINLGMARLGTQPGTIEIVFPNNAAVVVVNSAGELVALHPH